VRRLALNLALLLASLVLALALAEAVLRLAFPVHLSPEIEYEPDGHLGFRLTPSRRYLFESGPCTVNARGYRGTREIEVPKPRGTFRIVALGGSSTFGFEVADDDTWVTRLETGLRERLGAPIELVNAGVPGYNSFDLKIHYVYRIRALEPDAILVYETWNDLKRFRLLEEYGYFLRGVSHPGALAALSRDFQLLMRARQLYRDRVLRGRREDVYPTRAGFAQPIPRGGTAQRWERQTFEDLAAWPAQDGVLPILLSQAGLPSAANLDDPAVRGRIQVEYVGMSHEILLEQWELVSDLIRDAARDHGALFVDVRSAVPADTEHFLDTVHLSVRGNARVAEVVADALAADPRFTDRVRAVTGPASRLAVAGQSPAAAAGADGAAPAAKRPASPDSR
jgi:hypothetical protein